MSVFNRLAPLIPQVSASSRQTKEHPPACLSPPRSLSSPVIKKKPIQIPSFDEKGIIYEKNDTNQTNTDRSFVPICSSKTSSRPSWSKSCHYSQRNHGERASTLPRTKPKTQSSPTLSAKPSISIFPAPNPNSSPTLKPKPRDSLHLPASQLSDPSPLLPPPPPKPSVSPTLTVPTPRLSPSPTSLSRGVSLDSQGTKQPSPVAKERRARSITISNPKAEPESSKHRSSNEAKRDILDQETLVDFTHPVLRKPWPMTCRESQRQAATYQHSCLLQGKVSKKESTAKDKPDPPPPRSIGVSAIPKPNIKQQQEFLPSGATGTQTPLSESEGITFANVVRGESQAAFDGLASQSSQNLHRKRIDFPESRRYTQSAGFTSKDESYERLYPESIPVTPETSFSTEPLLNQSDVSPNIETRRRRFGFSNETKMETTFLSGSNLRRHPGENDIQTIIGNASQNIKPPQKRRFWSKAQSQSAQMDVKSTVSPSDCVSKDYSCQSRDIDRKVEAPQCAHRLSQLKTCLVAPHPQEASRHAPVECTASKTTFTKPVITSHRYQLDQQTPGQNKSLKEVNLSDTALNQTDIFAASDHHRLPTELPEYPSEKCVVSWPPSVARCPFNTNSFGIGSKGVFDLSSQPQHRAYQRPEQTTASPPLHQLNYSPADRAFIMEEPEDPYYVTMYYPGSVYVGEYRDIQSPWHDRDSFVSRFNLELNNFLSEGAGAQMRGVVKEDSRGV